MYATIYGNYSFIYKVLHSINIYFCYCSILLQNLFDWDNDISIFVSVCVCLVKNWNQTKTPRNVNFWMDCVVTLGFITNYINLNSEVMKWQKMLFLAKQYEIETLIWSEKIMFFDLKNGGRNEIKSMFFLQYSLRISKTEQSFIKSKFSSKTKIPEFCYFS